MIQSRRRTISLAVAAVAGIAVVYVVRGVAQRTPESQLVDATVGALGGRDRILNVRTLVLEGSGRHFNLAAMMSPTSVLHGEAVRLIRTIDMAHSRMKYWQSRRFLLPARFDQQLGETRQFSMLDGDVAFTVPADGSIMGSWSDSNPDGLTSIGSTWGIGSPGRPVTMDVWPTNYPAEPPPPQRNFGNAATTRRIEMLEYPLTIMREVLAGANVTQARELGNWQVVDITTRTGEQFTLAVDRFTKLPAWLSHVEGNNYWGDTVVKTSFSAYRTMDGLVLPRRLTSTFGPFFQADYELTSTTIDAEIGDLSAPSAVRNASAPPPQALQLMVEDVPGTSGMWKITPKQGEIRPDQRPDNSGTCLIELSDHLVMFDAPVGDGFVQAVVAKARELRPDKPITQLILSHFDPGHTAGLRAGVAQGMELITDKGNADAFAQLVGRAHTINPDALARNPRPPKITAVDDAYEIKDSLRDIRIYHKVGDPESATMVMAYIPRDRVLVNTDGWNVITAQTPNDSDSPSMFDNIVKRHLDVVRHVPLHSIGMPTQAEFMKQLEYTRSVEYQFFRLAQRLRVDNGF